MVRCYESLFSQIYFRIFREQMLKKLYLKRYLNFLVEQKWCVIRSLRKLWIFSLFIQDWLFRITSFGNVIGNGVPVRFRDALVDSFGSYYVKHFHQHFFKNYIIVFQIEKTVGFKEVLSFKHFG